jgi:hypothetical protein
MEPSTELALGTRTTMSALRLWLVVLSCASVSAVLITALQRTSELSPTRARRHMQRRRNVPRPIDVVCRTPPSRRTHGSGQLAVIRRGGRIKDSRR